jgi:putative tryptophan/tyrosine transport system substrate-binding protein
VTIGTRQQAVAPGSRNQLAGKNSASNPVSKKIFCLTLSALLLAHSFPAAAQQPAKVSRIGYLAASDAARESARAEGIRLALRELGYLEGQNIAIEYRYAEGKRDRFPELAAELVRLKVDIIVAAGGTVEAAKNASKTIPIVMTGTGLDPVEAGVVESLARPGGNVTGITNLGGELGGKRLELLKEAVPKVARVAVLYDPAVPAAVLDVREVLPAAARALKLTIQSWEVRDADGFEKVFAALTKQRPDGLYVPRRGPLMNANEKRIASFALKSRLPSVYGYRGGVEAGGLMYYGGGPRGQLPAHSYLRGQNPQGSQACRIASRAADEVRAGDQS